jgi:hypothetical protein
MLHFNEDAPVQGAHALYDLVVASSPKMSFFIEIFEEPNHEEGRSLALQLWAEIGRAIIVNGDQDKCAPLLSGLFWRQLIQKPPSHPLSSYRI